MLHVSVTVVPSDGFPETFFITLVDGASGIYVLVSGKHQLFKCVYKSTY